MPARVGRIGGLIAVALAVTTSTTAIATSVRVAHAADAAGSVELRRITTLGGTTAFAARTGDATVYVTEQAGRVRAIRNGNLVARPVLDLQDDTEANGEQGLLGLAFAPDGNHLYVDYTDDSGDTHIDEFAMAGRVADKASRQNLLVIGQPQPNHNGGQLAFGPDDDLYIALGDGGGANDEGSGHASGGNGQSLRTLLGKILRIDPTPSGDAPYTVPAGNPFVDTDDALPEIWAYGLRNPWRFSFDTDTGDLWIGDVGQNEWEEIDMAPATSGRNGGRGDNFGWNRLEGTHEFRGNPPANALLPVYEQAHDDGACSVTGGFVYRGTAIPALAGTYVFTDYCDSTLRTLTPSGNDEYRAGELGLDVENVSSFGQDNAGELYVLSQSRGIYKLVPP
jgi:glucose/arabinose dehydrogenase